MPYIEFAKWMKAPPLLSADPQILNPCAIVPRSKKLSPFFPALLPLFLKGQGSRFLGRIR